MNVLGMGCDSGRCSERLSHYVACKLPESIRYPTSCTPLLVELCGRVSSAHPLLCASTIRNYRPFPGLFEILKSLLTSLQIAFSWLHQNRPGGLDEEYQDNHCLEASQKTALLDVQCICVCVPTGLNTSWSWWWFLGAIIDMPLYI